MKNLFILVMVVAVVSIGANTGHSASYWAKTYGEGANFYKIKSSQPTTDGGYILAGSASNDMWVMKIDQRGNILWEKLYGGSSSEAAYSVQQTTDGGYIVAGFTSSFGSDLDYWVVKLTESGLVEWQKSYGLEGNDDSARSIQLIDDDGDGVKDDGYIIAGRTGPDGVYNDYNAWILKIDRNGDVLWQTTYDRGNASDMASFIQQTTDGGYIVAGETNMFDAWVLKLDRDGGVVWKTNYMGRATQVRQTEDGGYIVVGATDQDKDVLVRKYDENGQNMWQKAYNNNLNWKGEAIQQTEDGGYIVVARTYAFAGGVWLLKLDSTGTIDWQKEYDSSSYEAAYSIQQTTDGGYIVGAETLSSGMVLKLNENGDIPGCENVNTTNGTAYHPLIPAAYRALTVSQTSIIYVENTFPAPGETTVLIQTVCEFSDSDDDGVADGEDNCPLVSNPDQTDTDGDSIGDACENLLYLDSDAGDFIGKGQELIYTVDHAEFTADLNYNNINRGVRVRVQGDSINDYWGLNFDAPGDTPLTPGIYEGALRFPVNAAAAGLSVSGQGRGCNELSGIFEVMEVTYTPGGEVESFAASFEQHCEFKTEALRGMVRYENLDIDNDGIPDDADNCPDVSNPTQADGDFDGVGDVCDNCPTNCNYEQLDANSNSIGDVCDPTSGCGGCTGIQCEQECVIE
jgi:hypothetical protein